MKWGVLRADLGVVWRLCVVYARVRIAAWLVCWWVLCGVLVWVLGVLVLGLVVQVLGRSRGFLVGLGLGGVAGPAAVAGRSRVGLGDWPSYWCGLL